MLIILKAGFERAWAAVGLCSGVGGRGEQLGVGVSPRVALGLCFLSTRRISDSFRSHGTGLVWVGKVLGECRPESLGAVTVPPSAPACWAWNNEHLPLLSFQTPAEQAKARLQLVLEAAGKCCCYKQNYIFQKCTSIVSEKWSLSRQ